MIRIVILAGLLMSPWSAYGGDLEKEVAQVIDLFYDLRFDEALEASLTLETEHPGHPAGPFYRSIVYYQRLLVEDPRQPETMAEFRKHNLRCIAAAKKLKKSDPVTAHYYLGAAHGFLARIMASRGELWGAIRNARKAIKYLKRVVKKDPEREDVYLGMGMYNYFMSRVPAGAKPFAFLLVGHWGNREKGLRQIDRAAHKAPVARWEARSVLAAIYSSERERKWGLSETLLKELMERYPHNPLYRLRRAYVAQRRGAFDEALALADPGGTWIDELTPSLRKNARSMARYRRAECLLFSGKIKEAGLLFSEIEKGEPPARLTEWLMIRKANLLEIKGYRDKALPLYRSVKGKYTKEAAKVYRKVSFMNSPKIFKPLQWPLSDVPR